ncbi:MAG: hypothetical protein GEV05_09740 [Betaproteobacteria bacterium]|nr:hypothetical protein [Betaproteobacteria bacterium]
MSQASALLLDASASLRYVPDALNGEAGAAAPSLSLRAWDGTSGTATNGAARGTSDVTEGAANVALDDIVVSDVDGGETIAATLTLGNAAAGTLAPAPSVRRARQTTPAPARSRTGAGTGRC